MKLFKLNYIFTHCNGDLTKCLNELCTEMVKKKRKHFSLVDNFEEN